MVYNIGPDEPVFHIKTCHKYSVALREMLSKVKPSHAFGLDFRTPRRTGLYRACPTALTRTNAFLKQVKPGL